MESAKIEARINNERREELYTKRRKIIDTAVPSFGKNIFEQTTYI